MARRGCRFRRGPAHAGSSDVACTPQAAHGVLCCPLGEWHGHPHLQLRCNRIVHFFHDFLHKLAKCARASPPYPDTGQRRHPRRANRRTRPSCPPLGHTTPPPTLHNIHLTWGPDGTPRSTTLHKTTRKSSSDHRATSIRAAGPVSRTSHLAAPHTHLGWQ